MSVQIDERKLENMKKIIIGIENANIRSNAKNDAEMIKMIKEKIREEVSCFSNRLN